MEISALVQPIVWLAIFKALVDAFRLSKVHARCLVQWIAARLEQDTSDLDVRLATVQQRSIAIVY